VIADAKEEVMNFIMSTIFAMIVVGLSIMVFDALASLVSLSVCENVTVH